MEKKNYILRKAMMADISAITTIEQDCFAEDSFTKNQFAYLIKHAKGWFYVIECENQILGYVSLLGNARTHNLRIYSIAIHPGSRGMGFGQVLMEQATKTAQKHHMAKVTLEVNVSNYCAIALYKKNGFVYVSVKKGYYQNGADAFYMQKSIQY